MEYGTAGLNEDVASFEVEQKQESWPFTLFLADKATPLLQNGENREALLKMVNMHRKLCYLGIILALILFSVTITAHGDLLFIPFYAAIAAAAKVTALFAEKRRNASLFLLHMVCEGLLVLSGFAVIAISCWMGIHEVHECREETILRF